MRETLLLQRRQRYGKASGYDFGIHISGPQEVEFDVNPQCDGRGRMRRRSNLGIWGKELLI